MPKTTQEAPIFLGVNLMMDPAVAVVQNGQVLAYSEEERHNRYKHSPGVYPVNALKYCLDVAQCRPEDVAAISAPLVAAPRFLYACLSGLNWLTAWSMTSR